MSVEDSRCPTGAQCLVPGTVKATIAYKPGPVNSSESFLLHLYVLMQCLDKDFPFWGRLW
jgi:hypothetical protein